METNNKKRVRRHKVFTTWTKITVYSKLSHAYFSHSFSTDREAFAWLVQYANTMCYTYTISRGRDVSYVDANQFPF